MDNPRKYKISNPTPFKSWDGKHLFSCTLTSKSSGTTLDVTLLKEEIDLYDFINEKMKKVSDDDIKKLIDLIEEYGDRKYSEGYDCCNHELQGD